MYAFTIFVCYTNSCICQNRYSFVQIQNTLHNVPNKRIVRYVQICVHYITVLMLGLARS